MSARTPRYAERTTVAPDRSVAEIKRLVKSHGATAWGHGEDDDLRAAWVQFKIGGHLYRFTVRYPQVADRGIAYDAAGRLRTARGVALHLEREKMRRWREMVLLIRAKLVAIASGVVTAQEELLPYLVLGDDRTVAEHIVPALDQITRSTMELPALPPALIVEEE